MSVIASAAKQSRKYPKNPGLLRRYAPRKDGSKTPNFKVEQVYTAVAKQNLRDIMKKKDKETSPNTHAPTIPPLHLLRLPQSKPLPAEEESDAAQKNITNNNTQHSKNPQDPTAEHEQSSEKEATRSRSLLLRELKEQDQNPFSVFLDLATECQNCVNDCQDKDLQEFATELKQKALLGAQATTFDAKIELKVECINLINTFSNTPRNKSKTNKFYDHLESFSTILGKLVIPNLTPVDKLKYAETIFKELPKQSLTEKKSISLLVFLQQQLKQILPNNKTLLNLILSTYENIEQEQNTFVLNKLGAHLKSFITANFNKAALKQQQETSHQDPEKSAQLEAALCISSDNVSELTEKIKEKVQAEISEIIPSTYTFWGEKGYLYGHSLDQLLRNRWFRELYDSSQNIGEELIEELKNHHQEKLLAFVLFEKNSSPEDKKTNPAKNPLEQDKIREEFLSFTLNIIKNKFNDRTLFDYHGAATRSSDSGKKRSIDSGGKRSIFAAVASDFMEKLKKIIELLEKNHATDTSDPREKKFFLELRVTMEKQKITKENLFFLDTILELDWLLVSANHTAELFQEHYALLSPHLNRKDELQTCPTTNNASEPTEEIIMRTEYCQHYLTHYMKLVLDMRKTIWRAIELAEINQFKNYKETLKLMANELTQHITTLQRGVSEDESESQSPKTSSRESEPRSLEKSGESAQNSLEKSSDTPQTSPIKPTYENLYKQLVLKLEEFLKQEKQAHWDDPKKTNVLEQGINFLGLGDSYPPAVTFTPRLKSSSKTSVNGSSNTTLTVPNASRRPSIDNSPGRPEPSPRKVVESPRLNGLNEKISKTPKSQSSGSIGSPKIFNFFGHK